MPISASGHWGLLRLVPFLVLAGCVFDSRESRRGQVVENEVAGRLFDAEGRPVPGAIVLVVPVDHVPKGGLVKRGADSSGFRSLTTQADGRYVIDSLPAGRYNLLGSAGGAYSFRDSVVFDEGTDSVPSDTLRAPGSLAARVILEPNHDPRTVFVQVLGTDRFVAAGDGGWFTLRGLAAGEYSLRIVSILAGYTPDFPSVRIRSGAEDTLRTPFRPVYTGIPVVRSLTVRFDTSAGTAHLSWPAVAYPFLREYLVYRFLKTAVTLPDAPVARLRDTVFVDSLAHLIVADARAPVFEYRVRVRNLSDDVGPAFAAAEVEAASREAVATTLVVRSLEAQGFRGGIGDSLLLEVRWTSSTRKPDSLFWSFGASGLLRARALSGLAGADTAWVVLPDTAGTKLLTVKVKDEAGDAWATSATLLAELDVPRADAGRDTVVTPKDSIRLRGRAFQEFGRIVKWEWDIGGTGNFAMTSAGDTAFRAGSMPGTASHVLKVTDEDGNTGLDTVRVQVALDAPTARAGSDTTVTINDRVQLRGRGDDRSGSVVLLEWDIGARGTFRAVAGGDTLIDAGGVAGIEAHVLRVTDDDGITALDTLKVNVVDDVPEPGLASFPRLHIDGGGYRFSASASDMGRIVKWEWDIGGAGAWVAGSGPDTAFIPSHPADSLLQVRVRATDEDGNSAGTSISVKVSKWSLVGIAPRWARTAAMAWVGGKLFFSNFEGDFQYTPTTGQWESLPTNAGLSYGHALAALDGKLYAFGAKVMEWDPAASRWTRRFDPPQPLGTSSAVVSQGRIFVINETGAWFGEYHPADDSWSPAAPSDPNVGHPAALSAWGGKIYAAGRRKLAEFDPQTGAWRVLSTYPEREVGAVVALNGRIHYLLSQDGIPSAMPIYDLASDLWEWKSAYLVRPTYWHGAVAADGKIYCIGGETMNGGLPWLQVYDPELDR